MKKIFQALANVLTFIIDISPAFLKNFKYFDKILHMFFGAVFFILIWLIFSLIVAYIAILCIAVLKEIFDWLYRKSYFCFWDVVATISVPILVFVVRLVFC